MDATPLYRIERLSYCNVNNDIGMIDLPNTVFMLVQASLFLFYFASKLVFLSEILAAFPLFVKNAMHNCFLRSLTFFRYRRVWHFGRHVRKLIDLDLNALHCKVKVLGVIQYA